jgi:hypothetical protein
LRDFSTAAIVSDLNLKDQYMLGHYFSLSLSAHQSNDPSDSRRTALLNELQIHLCTPGHALIWFDLSL